ncbi:hypothetical protein PPERSA_01072 [Pseudocohnilembus persalinus]|uniref:Uncharacterized protein n=1 Tax=Pseudocohnilembus persalinus TaxID=266149 RepID=A0A0V0QVB4_PSEPJ|nr:hypothetical protein PPERSA_01072 [Pseudocohnilembus persalinus]|eukprot:KRX05994.1 hypothetical protein PPERSA_01072 [Pseudocohnilembus persalinus]
MFSFSVSNLYDNYKLKENENESLNSQNNHPTIQNGIKKSQNINKKKIEELQGYEKILVLKKLQQEKDAEQEEPVQQIQVQPQIVQPRQKQIDLNSNYYGNNGLDPSGKVKIFDTSKMRKHNIAQIAPNQFVVKGKFPGPQNFVEEVLDDFNYQDIQKSKVYYQVQQILQAEDQQQVEEFNTQINEIKQKLQLYREKMYKGDPFMSGYEDKEEIKMNQEIERLQKEKDLAFENLKNDEEYQAKRKVKEIMLLKEFEIRNKELESKKVITLDKIPRKRMLEIIDKYANEKKEIKLYDLRYKDQIDKHLEKQNQFFTENRTLDGQELSFDQTLKCIF